MEPNYSWIYLLIFLIIPLTRILPRVMAKRRMKNAAPQAVQENMTYTSHEEPAGIPDYPSKPQTMDMLVLGELDSGTRTFEGIRKNTGLDSAELDKLLESLEKDGMLEARQKQGLLGLKTELYLTEKGFREYHS